MDNSTNNKNIFQSELPCEKKNGHSIIQEFINNYPYGVQDLIKLLECGYQITYEDRKIMKEQFPTDTYKVGSINSIFYFLHKTAEPFNCLEQDNLA